jgi:hypothetical protein
VYRERKSPSSEPDLFHFVGEPGIEPGPRGPKPRTLPLCYTPMSERGTVGVVANAIFSEIESLLSMKEKIAFEQNKGFCFVTPTVSLNEEGLYRAEGEDTLR